MAVCLLYEPVKGWWQNLSQERKEQIAAETAQMKQENIALKQRVEELNEKAESVAQRAEEIAREAKGLIKEEAKQIRKKGELIKEEGQTLKKGEDINIHNISRVEIPAPLKGRSERILKRTGYTTSYNKDWKQPNWVAWQLTPQKLKENVERNNEFLPDPDLKVREAVTTNDYKRSGYDRGHMCPAGDSKWSAKAMQESFYMTNICPQEHELNRSEWNELEQDCRRWAQKEGSIYIVCGPIFHQGKHEVIGREQKIPVPDAFFKVVLCLKSQPAKAIGFTFVNTGDRKKQEVKILSIDQVEKLTGIDFFPALPDDLEKRVEASCDAKLWR